MLLLFAMSLAVLSFFVVEEALRKDRDKISKFYPNFVRKSEMQKMKMKKEISMIQQEHFEKI